MTDRRHTDPLTGEIHDDPPIREFASWLIEQARGRTHQELSEALYDLTQRVSDTGKKGKLTLTVTVEPVPKSDGKVLQVTDEIKLALPEYDRPASIFYSDRYGNLSRSDPRQEAIPGLVDVPAEDKGNLR